MSELEGYTTNELLLLRHKAENRIYTRKEENAEDKRKIDQLNAYIYEKCQHRWEREPQFHGPSNHICLLCRLYKGPNYSIRK